MPIFYEARLTAQGYQGFRPTEVSARAGIKNSVRLKSQKKTFFKNFGDFGFSFIQMPSMLKTNDICHCSPP